LYYFSQEFLNKLDSTVIEIISYILEKAEKQNSNTVVITPEEWLLDDENLYYALLSDILSVLNILENYGYFTYEVDKEKNITVHLTEEFLNSGLIVELDKTASKDYSLFKRDNVPDGYKKARGKKKNNVISLRHEKRRTKES